MKTQKYIVTAAQNNTPIHQGFFETLQVFCKEEHAELIVVPYRYRNPTAPNQDSEDFWADEVQPYLAARVRRAKEKTLTVPVRRKLAKDLAVFSDVSIAATAANPLSGFEGFAGHSSCIFGHAKRALKVVPTSTRFPRTQYTTSACTVENYSDTKEGKKARFHHVIGALVVEVDSDGEWWCRHVSADRSGAFYDLDARYTPEGVQRAHQALTLTLGDYHCGTVEDDVLDATKRLYDLIQPKAMVLHDFLDFRNRNHHETTISKRVRGAALKVEDEVNVAALELLWLASWGDAKLVIVRSNHDEAFERWINEFRADKDPLNAPYYHAVLARALELQQHTGKFPNLFEMECRRLGVKKAKVRFLGRNDSYLVKDVEHGFHGDKGPNGSRGSNTAFRRMGVKMTKGHDHTEGVEDGVVSIGVTGSIDQGYNTLPSTWTNSHCILQPDGKRQLVRVRKGRYRGGERS